MWLRRTSVWTLCCFALICLPALVAQVLGGVLVGVWLIGLLVGGAELTAPRAFLHWRTLMLEGQPPSVEKVAAYADRHLLPSPARTEATHRRVRVLGLVVILGITVEAALIWLICVRVGLL